MLNKDVPDELTMLEDLQKYLVTRIETSRGICKINVDERDSVRSRVTHRVVEYDCHDIKITVNNTAPTVPKYPTVAFMGLALFVNFKQDENVIFQRWKTMNLPKVDLKNTDQSVDVVSRNPQNQFPLTKEKYFPRSTHVEQSHGYSLFPGESITWDMNVLLSECIDLKDMNLWVEATISRRHLYHVAKEITS